ncbi:MAG: hypothetical protein PHV71_01930 [Eubacteriales bacterium]|nr:hypothetical protein [Eubacteriales bacterium]MDD3200267.1 hypothetical protein [Eubacteriales bacterium]MDD4122552.1 hypothetical protein [Eubacteriales bacterium]MDD4629345.1 hypothetical protein [Eubacteriales bacterium]
MAVTATEAEIAMTMKSAASLKEKETVSLAGKETFYASASDALAPGDKIIDSFNSAHPF